jgi:hypothetical protein
MSLDKQEDIIQSLRSIGSESPISTEGCKAFGKMFFQIKHRLFLEADIYFSNGCTYFVYIINGVPVWSNEMSTEGVVFFNEVLKQKK